MVEVVAAGFSSTAEAKLNVPASDGVVQSAGGLITAILQDPDAGMHGRSEAVDIALSMALIRSGHVPLHALAAVKNGVCIVAPASTRSGKSTLALAVQYAGGQVISDDMVFLTQRSGGGWTVTTVRPDIWLRERPAVDLDGIDALAHETVPSGHRFVVRRERSPQRFAETGCVDAIVAIGISDRASTRIVSVLNQAERYALLVNASSPMLVADRSEGTGASLRKELFLAAERLSGYRIELGRDLLDAPAQTTDRLWQEIVAAGKPGVGSG
ncbi:MAG: hypothetical protein KDG50_09230 [Chromatiales bacterium]|nr:hypothetical protein [Chromatiales bacterium]